MATESTKIRLLILADDKSIAADFHRLLQVPQQQNNLFQRLWEKILRKKESKSLFPELDLNFCQSKQAKNEILKAIKDNNPFSIVITSLGEDTFAQIRLIWALDSHIQIIFSIPTNVNWVEKIKNFERSPNYILLEQPYDSLVLRQAIYSLADKWSLASEVRNYTHFVEWEIKERMEELYFQTTHDFLTGLQTRALLVENLNLALEQDSGVTAVFYIDLDRFKLINEGLTHGIGDQVLQLVGTRLKEDTAQYSSLVARLGGDEFIVAITGLSNLEEVKAIAKNLLLILAKPYFVSDRELALTGSIGVSYVPNDRRDAEILIRNADIAMHKAKKRGPNSFQFYTPEFNQQSFERLEIENHLFRALKRNEFVLYYQPQIELKTGNFTGIEALIRWQHPKKGLIQPNQFIWIAEETGLILQIGEWALRTACKQAKIWQEKLYQPLRIAINVAERQLEQPQLVETIGDILASTQLEPQYFEIEVTENVILQNADIITTVKALEATGIQVTLDDFGSGYSNLSYLRKLPVARIKIDKSYIQNIGFSPDDEAIIRAIIAMAKSLNLRTLAEGVETEAQLAFLLRENCDEAQGFYFSPPLKASQVEYFLSSQKDRFPQIVKNSIIMPNLSMKS